MRRKMLSLVLGLAILALPAGCGKGGGTPAASADGDPGLVIDQAVGYLNSHRWEKWIDLWVPEDREEFRKFLKEQPEETGLKNIKTARMVRRVDVTGKVPVNPGYPFVGVRAYYVELDLAVKKEEPSFRNGRNNHLVLVLKKTVADPWAIRQWGASPDLTELLKPRRAPAR